MVAHMGAVQFVWPCNIDATVEVVNTQSNRMCVLRVYNDLNSLLFINVYMPCESSDVACDEFCTVLAQVKSIVEQYSESELIFGGDFNVDFDRVSTHSDILNQFCTVNNIFPVDRHELSNVDYTYNFCMQRFSNISSRNIQ